MILVLAIATTATWALQESNPASAPGPDAMIAPAVERSRALLPALDHRIEHVPGSVGLRMERLQHLFVLGVEDRDYLDEGDREIEKIRALTDPLTVDLVARLTAYTGVYEVVRGKHANWPLYKLGHVRDGLADLDAAVRARPRDALVRYLRLTSCFQLPGFLGRGETVEEDTRMLAALLAEGEHTLSTDEVLTMATFLLDEATLDSELRSRLGRVVVAQAAAGGP